MTVAREQRSVERFSKGDVNGVVGREIVPQIPDTRQKEVMRISVQGKVCQVGQSRTATVIIDFATRRIPADHLRDFDIEQMRRVQSFPIAFSANHLSWFQGKGHFRAALQTHSQLIERRPLSYPAKLAKQVIGERHARQRRTRFELTMQCIRHIANLDHRGHVHHMNPCAAQSTK